MTICKYIEKRREQYGIALFVIPILIVAYVIVAIAYGLALLFA